MGDLYARFFDSHLAFVGQGITKQEFYKGKFTEYAIRGNQIIKNKKNESLLKIYFLLRDEYEIVKEFVKKDKSYLNKYLSQPLKEHINTVWKEVRKDKNKLPFYLMTYIDNAALEFEKEMKTFLLQLGDVIIMNLFESKSANISESIKSKLHTISKLNGTVQQTFGRLQDKFKSVIICNETKPKTKQWATLSDDIIHIESLTLAHKIIIDAYEKIMNELFWAYFASCAYEKGPIAKLPKTQAAKSADLKKVRKMTEELRLSSDQMTSSSIKVLIESVHKAFKEMMLWNENDGTSENLSKYNLANMTDLVKFVGQQQNYEIDNDVYNVIFSTMPPKGDSKSGSTNYLYGYIDKGRVWERDSHIPISTDKKRKTYMTPPSKIFMSTNTIVTINFSFDPVLPTVDGLAITKENNKVTIECKTDFKKESVTLSFQDSSKNAKQQVIHVVFVKDGSNLYDVDKHIPGLGRKEMQYKIFAFEKYSHVQIPLSANLNFNTTSTQNTSQIVSGFVTFMQDKIKQLFVRCYYMFYHAFKWQNNPKTSDGKSYYQSQKMFAVIESLLRQKIKNEKMKEITNNETLMIDFLTYYKPEATVLYLPFNDVAADAIFNKLQLYLFVCIMKTLNYLIVHIAQKPTKGKQQTPNKITTKYFDDYVNDIFENINKQSKEDNTFPFKIEIYTKDGTINRNDYDENYETLFEIQFKDNFDMASLETLLRAYAKRVAKTIPEHFDMIVTNNKLFSIQQIKFDNISVVDEKADLNKPKGFYDNNFDYLDISILSTNPFNVDEYIPIDNVIGTKSYFERIMAEQAYINQANKEILSQLCKIADKKDGVCKDANEVEQKTKIWSLIPKAKSGSTKFVWISS